MALGFIIIAVIAPLIFVPFDKLCSALPLESSQIERARLQPRQLRFRQNPDGSISGSIAASESIDIPGQGHANLGFAQNFKFGPQGSSIDGGQSYNSNIGGNQVNFGQSNSQNTRQGPMGFTSTGSNSAANSFQNPFFQSSNANANSFANQFQQPFRFK